jgi:hypothetical protein
VEGVKKASGFRLQAAGCTLQVSSLGSKNVSVIEFPEA